MRLGRGSLREHFVTIQGRAHFVGTKHVLEWQRMRGCGHVVKVEGLDVGRVAENAAELTSEMFDLILGEREPGKLRDVDDVGGGNRISHERASLEVALVVVPYL